MRDKKLKKLLQEHPYLIDAAFVRSRSEAMRLARESSVTVEDFIERAKGRSALSAWTWDVFTEVLSRRHARVSQKNSTIKPNIFLPIMIMPRFLRRAVAVLIILAFLTAFFTMTKPGVALAQAAYKIIVRLFDGKLTAQQNQCPDNLVPIDFENIPEQFESLEQAARLIGRPVASIGYANAELISIDAYSSDGLCATIKTQYQAHDNILFLKQVFYETISSWGTVVSSDTIELAVELQDGNTMYIGYMDDGTAFGNAYSKSYNISVSCKGMDINELLDIIAGLYFLE